MQLPANKWLALAGLALMASTLFEIPGTDGKPPEPHEDAAAKAFREYEAGWRLVAKIHADKLTTGRITDEATSNKMRAEANLAVRKKAFEDIAKAEAAALNGNWTPEAEAEILRGYYAPE